MRLLAEEGREEEKKRSNVYEALGSSWLSEGAGSAAEVGVLTSASSGWR